IDQMLLYGLGSTQRFAYARCHEIIRIAQKNLQDVDKFARLVGEQQLRTWSNRTHIDATHHSDAWYWLHTRMILQGCSFVVPGFGCGARSKCGVERVIQLFA